MWSYEKDQERLQTLMEECLTTDDNPSEVVFEDDEDENEEDRLTAEILETDTEQEISDEEEENVEETVATPYFLGKDKISKWEKHVPPKNVRTRSENLVTHLPGPKAATRNLKTPLEIWSYFFNHDILEIIVEHTNQKINAIKYNYSRERDANPTNITEVKALLGLVYLAGVKKCARTNAEELWKTDGSGIELFRLTMSCSRFRFLLRHLRFDDSDTREERKATDKLAAIRSVFDAFVEKCKTAFTPFEYVTVDEKLEAFRGRCGWRQYIPSKPNKYGLKVFALCDSKTYYTLNLEVYVGNQPAGPFKVSNSPGAVVERLAEPIRGTGRNITVDNWFTNLELIANLKQNFRLTLLGTIRKNKRELPPEFANPSTRSEKTSMFAFHKNCTLVSYIPKPKKNVLLVSSMHTDDALDKNTGKPEMIMLYNQTKGGVDMVDKLCSIYDCARNTCRWPMVIFYSLLNVGCINSFVIFLANNINSTIPRREFIHQLSFALIEEHLKTRVVIRNMPTTIKIRIREILGLENTTLPEEAEERRGRCAVCDRKKNRPTRYYCRKCNKFLCLEHSVIMCDECIQSAYW